MGKLNEWLDENPYSLELDSAENLILVRTDTNSLIDIKKEVLQNNSATKQLFIDLKKEKCKDE